MKYKIGDLIVFMHGLQSGNVATIGTIISSRPLEDYPQFLAYTVHHPWIDRQYEYSEDHLKSCSMTAHQYVGRYGSRIITERVGLNGQ